MKGMSLWAHAHITKPTGSMNIQECVAVIMMIVSMSIYKKRSIQTIANNFGNHQLPEGTKYLEDV